MLRNFRRKVATAFSSARQGCHGSRPRGGNRLRFETLESRLVLDAGPVVISELMALNTAGLPDGANDFNDWVEIHNRGTDPVNLKDWYLTDQSTNLTRWQFPDAPLDGGGSLIVFASGKYPNGPAGELHTNFSLKRGGEYLALVRPDGESIASAFEPEFPEQYADVSYGWSADFSTLGYFTSPTPGAPNLTEQIADPSVQVSINEIMYDPAGGNLLEEYIEIYNHGQQAVNLTDWQISDGVQFTFEATIDADLRLLEPGEYLVVAADEATFSAKYPTVSNVVGGWEGRLSNSGEEIELRDAAGERIDRVTYADEGDWSVREVGPLDHEHYGWVWSDAHSGGGKSLELINPHLSNRQGQNWAASQPDGGTPGVANSVAATDIAPMILDVGHWPAIPRSGDTVTVTAELRDELATGLGASVYYRNDGDPTFVSVPMVDDGQHGDGAAGDGVFAAELPAAADGTVVEFYVQATDATIHTRTWPAPVEPSGEQLANLLYQVDNSFDPTAGWTPGSLPFHYIIMTEAERAELAEIGDSDSGVSNTYNSFFGEARSSAQMNATFISVDGVDTKVRYNTGVRNRGNRSRVGPPNNYRVNFRSDEPWKGIAALNINHQVPHDQVIGSAIHRMAGTPAPQAAPVEVRVNGQEIASIYAAVEVYNSDWAEHHLPDDPDGNLYRLRYHPIYPNVNNRTYADLDYKGPAPYDNPDDYRDNYGKSTNASADDWTDLLELIDKLNNPAISDAEFIGEVSQIIDLRQWMRYMATDFLAGNGEGGLLSGSGDDAAMYCGVNDRRFMLLPHDLDTLFSTRTSSIFGFERIDGLERLLNHPDAVQIYYAEYLDLIATVFAPENFDPLVDRVLGGFVSEGTRNSIKQFNIDRTALALSQIPTEFTITNELPVVEGYPRTAARTTTLTGTANAAETKSVTVNGQPVQWSKIDGTWSTDELTLRPGINRLIVQTFDGPDGTGNELRSDYIDIWCDVATVPENSELSVTVRDSYLPGTPFLVHVELRDQAGDIDRSVWNSMATIGVEQGNVQLSESIVPMNNGLGSVLVTPTGSGDFTLNVQLGGLSVSRALSSLAGQPVTNLSGTLSGTSTLLSGVVRVTDDLLVPTGHTLTLQPGTLVLIDGVASGSGGVDIDVEGMIQSNGTASSPVTFTASDSTEAWGEIHHNDALPSFYRFTNIHRAGHSPGGGHTNSGPALRPSGSTILFDHVTISDIDGKIIESTSGSDLRFQDSHLARAVMGPEIDDTALLFENGWVTEMWGNDDNDGFYVHSQAAGQDVTFRGGVFAGFDDDGLDTLSSTVTVEDVIFRDAADKGVSVLDGSVALSRIMSIGNDIGISAKGRYGDHLDVTIDHATITGNRLGIENNDKYGAPNVVTDLTVTNSIIWGNTDAIQTDYPQIADHIQVTYTNLSEPWPGAGNLNADPQFVMPSRHDYRLPWTSPSVNAGDPALGLDADGSRADQGYFDATTQGTPAPQSLSGSITEDTILSPAAGEYSVTGDVTVEPGATLSILPGTVVHFAAGTRLNVDGRLSAEGTQSQRITLSHDPAGSDPWDGIHFASSEDNRLTYVDMVNSSGTGESISTDGSRLLIDNMTWTGTDKTILDITDSSLIVRDSVFPETVARTVTGSGVLDSDPYMLFEGNIFGICSGNKQDVVHLSAGGPTPTVRFLDNTFLGGGDDGLDLDGTSAYIEGNVFKNFHKNFDPGNTGEQGESYAITAGNDAGHTSEHTIVRNTFFDVDHAVLVKDQAFVTLENNTVVRASMAGISFGEPANTEPVDPGLGASLDGNIFDETPTLLAHVLVDDPTWGSTDVTVDRSVVPTDALSLGTGNVDDDPMLNDPDNGLFDLLAGSPAVGSGSNGIDMGAIVPHGPSITGEPASPTTQTDATLTIDGPGITHYKYRVNNGPWSASRTVDTPLNLTNLDMGDYAGYDDLTVYVIGRDVSGQWEGEPEATVSASWEIGGAAAPSPEVEAMIANENVANALQAQVAGQVIPGGPIDTDVLLTAENGPYYVTGDAVVEAGATMTIEPGTTVFFDDGASLRIRGRLLAEGSQYDLIRFTRLPGQTNWDGIQFDGTMEDNRITYAVLEYATTSAGMIGLDYSNLLIDHCTLDHAERRRIRTINSSLIVRNSTFTELFPGDTPPLTNNGSEHLWGRYIPDGGHFIIENNIFGLVKGHNDALDFDAGLRPAPVMQILGNVFQGSGDDALDIEGDAHIEGNVFMHVREDEYHPDPGEANSISAGDAHGHGHEYVVTRNVFYDVAHASLIKENSFMTFVGNTVVDASGAALYFDLPGQYDAPGVGAYVDGNLFINTPIIFDHVLPETELTVNRSTVPAEYHHLGVGNLEPGGYLVDPAGGDFRLAPNLPDLGLGATVPAGIPISGEPAAVTASTEATLTVGIPAVPHYPVYSHYKYRLDGGQFSDEFSVDEPIQLTGLTEGPHTVEAIGLNTAGVWQTVPTVSRTWTVDTTFSRVRINEVLASNVTAMEHEGTYPDLIELINDGGQPVDLGGMSLSDDPDNPRRFVFPAGTVIQPGEMLTLFADDNTKTSGIHLGFALDNNGEKVTLYDTPANGAAELDSIAFGMQLDDLSIGRVGYDGEWTLTEPTFGAENIPRLTGDPASLSINEWFANGEMLLDDDFVELYNPDPAPVALGGLRLTDLPYSSVQEHSIAPLSFVAGSGYAELTADGNIDAGGDHVAFRLSSDQELLGLIDPARGEIDKVIYYTQTTNVSEGRTPDGSQTIEFFTLPSPGAANPAAGETIQVASIAIDDLWHYDQSGNDLGTAWREPGYTGGDFYQQDPQPALFYKEGSALNAPKNTPLTYGPTTFYFRKTFTLDADPADVTNFEISPFVDDGIILYLNGIEAFRIGVPAGEVNFDTYANRHVANADYEGPFSIPVNGPGNPYNLVHGENLIAVELHEENHEFARDLVFGLALDATAEQQGDALFAKSQGLLDGLRVSELMYHPAEDGELEFVELTNISDVPLDLTGVRLRGAVDGVLPDIMLPPGERIAVVRDLESYYTHYGSGADVAGQYEGSLSDGGEEFVLQLPAPFDAIIQRFDFNDDWYPSTDGGGYSLSIVDPTIELADFNLTASWQPSTVEGGSPGRDDTEPLVDGVVVSEALTHTDPPLTDAIELHNTSDVAIDVGGWFLSDSAGNRQKFRIPTDGSVVTLIQPDGYLVFDEADFNPSGGLDPEQNPNDFALSSANGDQVWLTRADAEGNPVATADYVTFSAARNGESFGRRVDDSGRLHFYPNQATTLPGENSSPRVGPVIISELHYNPGNMAGDDDLEFVELFNTTDAPVDLAHWRLRGGIDFDFSETMQIAPRSTLVVLPFDPADVANVGKTIQFLMTYELDSAEGMVGGYRGKLDNGGETVRLQRPDTPPPTDPDDYPQLLEDEVFYNDVAPWPTAADGTGQSLHRVGEDGWGHMATSWTTAWPTPGTVEGSVVAEVVGRHVFYNNSGFDGNDPTADARDDAALATDKTALLPMQTATFANYTNYDKGLNGIFVDIADIAKPAALSAADFEFRVGNNNDPDGWTPAEPLLPITVRTDHDGNDYDRVTIRFGDYAIQGQWLEVTVLATPNTGLAAPDVFYFGNAVGEAGDQANNTIVNATDEIVARNFQHGALDPADITDPFDYNRDRLVNGTDQIIARSYQTNPLTMLRLITAPTPTSAAVEAMQPSAESLIDLDWLYEYEQMNTKDRSPQKVSTVDVAIEQLLADDEI